MASPRCLVSPQPPSMSSSRVLASKTARRILSDAPAVSPRTYALLALLCFVASCYFRIVLERRLKCGAKLVARLRLKVGTSCCQPEVAVRPHCVCVCVSA